MDPFDDVDSEKVELIARTLGGLIFDRDESSFRQYIAETFGRDVQCPNPFAYVIISHALEPDFGQLAFPSGLGDGAWIFDERGFRSVESAEFDHSLGLYNFYRVPYVVFALRNDLLLTLEVLGEPFNLRRLRRVTIIGQTVSFLEELARRKTGQRP